MSIDRLGDRALRFALPEGADHRLLLDTLRADACVEDVVLAEATGVVLPTEETSLEALERVLVDCLARVLSSSAAASPTRATSTHLVRVIYDGADLAELAERLGLSTDAVVALHAGRDYEVAMIGFMPGFAYLHGLDPRLVLPRRSAPRPRVPARSVAMAAGYTGIYPFASPGGWHLLGEAADFSPFDNDGATLALGDHVRFLPTTRAAITAPPAITSSPVRVPPPTEPALEITKVLGLALLVDGGRRGHMHEGVPHGGAMIRSALDHANAALGNASGTCAIEVHGTLEVVARGGRATIADDLDGAHNLDDGESFTLACGGRTRARYLAVPGGVDVPLALGARGTLLTASLGGFHGGALKKGDALSLRSSSSARSRRRSDLPPSPIRILRGPDVSQQGLDMLLGTPFTISPSSDRTGTRLVGALPSISMHSAHDRRSQPMIEGAIEQTPSGLIVLGPDHPTTGGYPLVAVLSSDSHDRFFSLPLGSPVVFGL